jgi:hypothetical protein
VIFCGCFVDIDNQVALENANRAHGAAEMMYKGKIEANDIDRKWKGSKKSSTGLRVRRI